MDPGPITSSVHSRGIHLNPQVFKYSEMMSPGDSEMMSPGDSGMKAPSIPT